MWRNDISVFCGTEQACEGCTVTERRGEVYTSSSVAHMLMTRTDEDALTLSGDVKAVQTAASASVGTLHNDEGEYWLSAQQHREITNEVAQAFVRITTNMCRY